MRSRLFKLLALMTLCIFFSAVGYADVVYSVSINTSPLVGNSTAPFTLDFQLNDGRFVGDANNTALLTNFLFGGGNATGSAMLTGGATGSLSSTVTLTDSSNSVNDFQQGFTPGSSLSFTLTLSTHTDSGPNPDAFSFAILDNSLNNIPTQSFFDVFVEIDITGSAPQVHTFGTDPSRTGINIGPPTVLAQGGSPAPEPASVVLLGSGLAGMLVRVRRQGAARQRILQPQSTSRTI